MVSLNILINKSVISMSENNKETSAQEKLDKIIQEKSEKNKILKKLLKEISKDSKVNGQPADNKKNKK